MTLANSRDGEPAPRFVRSQCSVPIDRLGAIVAAAFAVPVQALHSRTRGKARTALARQSAIYLAHVALGMSCAEAGRLFGRDRTTAAHACRVIEERREDARIDAILSALEASCGADVSAGVQRQ
jgi:chromosomal replication initiation ATPase DnaA